MSARSSRTSARTGIGLVLISTLVFGSTPALVTNLRGALPVVDVISYRSLLGGALLYAAALLLDRSRSRSGDRVDVGPIGISGLMLGLLLYTPQILMFYSAFDHIDTSLGVAIGFVYPTLVLCMVAARARRWPAKVDVFLSLVALAGVLAMADPMGSGRVDPVGIVLVLGAALVYATYVVIAGDLVSNVSPLRLGAQVSFGVGIGVAGYGFVTDKLTIPSGRGEWLVVVIQGVLLVVAIGTYYAGLVRLGPTRTSLVDTAQPLIATLAGGLLLNEHLALVQFAGVLLVTGSVAATSVLAHRRPAIPFVDPP